MLKSYLCFDVSSTTIGITSFHFDTESKKLTDIKLSYYKPPHENGELSNLKETYNAILETIRCKIVELEDDKPNIVIEEAPMFMTGGGSSAGTIRILGVYTRIVGLAAFTVTEMEPLYIPVITIRSALRKLADKTDKVQKEEVPNVLETIITKLNGESWEFPYIKKEVKGKRKVKKLYEDETYDMADSLAVGIAALFKAGHFIK